MGQGYAVETTARLEVAGDPAKFRCMTIRMDELREAADRMRREQADPSIRVSRGAEIDMTPDGRFLPPPRTHGLPLTAKVGAIAAMVAAVAGAIAIAALALWVALMVIPVVLVAGVVAYGAFRFQMWRARGRNAVWMPPRPGSR